MVTLNKNTGLLSLLENSAREEVERKLRKHYQALDDYLSFLEEEIESLKWDLDKLLKGDKFAFRESIEETFGA